MRVVGVLFVSLPVNGLSMVMQPGASDPCAPGRIRTADTRFRREFTASGAVGRYMQHSVSHLVLCPFLRGSCCTD